jgi:benzoate/toluate 1,2-dioxygenase beta subunit
LETKEIAPVGMTPVSEKVEKGVVAFLYEEARLADEHRYAEWEALWTTDGIYWVPARGGRDTDPERQVSYIYDNRTRIHTRIGMLLSGEKFSQSPPSGLRRLISNIVVQGYDDAGDILVGANFILLESRREMTIWGGEVIYKLRPDGDDLKMAQKKIILANHGEPMRKMVFIL